VTQEPNDKTEETPGEASGSSRKERVIHTRVPAILELELKKLAGSLRVPVSNVVRAILEDAVAAVDVVGRRAEGDLRGMAERVAHNRDRLKGMARRQDSEEADRRPADAGEGIKSKPKGSKRTQEQGVLGWQSFVLASALECAQCGTSLDAGTEAFLGILQDPAGPRVVIGRECLPATHTIETKETKP